MWTLLIVSIIILILLFLGLLNHLTLVLISVSLLIFGVKIENKLFGNLKKPNKVLSILIILLLIIVILTLLFKFLGFYS
jgi:hypothetical protein